MLTVLKLAEYVEENFGVPQKTQKLIHKGICYVQFILIFIVNEDSQSQAITIFELLKLDTYSTYIIKTI